MKTFTIATLAVVGVSSVAAAAMEPRSTPKPLEKRQDDVAGQVTGLLNPLTGYLTNAGIASLVQSVAGNPEFLSAAAAAGTSDYAPFETLVGSLQADPTVSSVIYEALGTQSADEFYASASGVAAQLEAATATATATDAEPTDSASASEESSSLASSASEGASSLSSVASTAGATTMTSVTTSAPATGAAVGMINAGSVLPAVMAVFGVAAGAILL